MSHIKLVGGSSNEESSPQFQAFLARLEAEVEKVQTEIERTGVVHSATPVFSFSPTGEVIGVVLIYYSIEEVIGMADRMQGVSIRERWKDTEPPPDLFGGGDDDDGYEEFNVFG